MYILELALQLVQLLRIDRGSYAWSACDHLIVYSILVGLQGEIVIVLDDEGLSVTDLDVLGCTVGSYVGAERGRSSELFKNLGLRLCNRKSTPALHIGSIEFLMDTFHMVASLFALSRWHSHLNELFLAMLVNIDLSFFACIDRYAVFIEDIKCVRPLFEPE